jgi:K+-sensing histidine kinase KdpD
MDSHQLRAHSFRTQIATIMSSVELLLQYGAAWTDAEREELLCEIRIAAQRMRGMLDQPPEARDG